MSQSLSAIESYDASHLHESAAYLSESGENWAFHFSRVAMQLPALDWQGEAGTAAATRADADALVAGQSAATVQAAAAANLDAAGTMMSLRSFVLSQAQAATTAGFEVGDDGSVTDPTGKRKGVASTLQANLQRHMQTMHETSQAIAATHQAAAAALDDTAFADGRSVRGHASMVDNHFKLDGPGSTIAPAPPSPATPQAPWKSGFAPGPMMPIPAGTTPDGSPVARMPAPANPPVGVINANVQPPKPDPKDHDCSVREIVDGAGQVFGGTATAGAGVAGIAAGAAAEAPSLGTSTIPIIAGVGGVATGTKLITDGLDDLSHCTNDLVGGDGK